MARRSSGPGRVVQRSRRRLRDVQARLRALERTVATLDTRAAALESRAGLSGRATRPEPDSADAPGGLRGNRSPPDSAAFLALAGRTLLVLGGAYLLRALAEASAVPVSVAAVAGLAYAAAWLHRANRDASDGRGESALFHGTTAAAIAFPLLWEAATRFRIVPQPVAACALVAVFASALAVAARRRLVALAWIVTLAAAAEALALLVATRELLWLLLALLAMAGAVEAAAWRLGWNGLRWPMALGVDGAAWAVAAIAGRPAGIPEGYPLLSPVRLGSAEMLLPLLYGGSLMVRTRVRPLTVFDAIQVPAALLLGLGGARDLLAVAGAPTAWAGLAALVAGLSSYVGSARTLTSRDRAGTFHFQAALGLVLIVTGGSWLVGAPVLGVALAGLAVGFAAFATRPGRDAVAVHAAALLVVAAVASGLAGFAADGLLTPPTGTWRPLEAPAAGAMLASAACFALLASVRRRDAVTGASPLPRSVAAGVLAVSAVALAARGLAALLGAGPGTGADAALVATARTAALAATAAGLARLGPSRAWGDLRWLAYALLAAAAVKLVLEDLPQGRPATSFLSLSLCGAALLAMPRPSR